MRRVSDPNGVAWSVDVSWTDIHFGARFKGRRERRAQERRARAQAKSKGQDDGDRGWWVHAIDAVPPDDFPGGFIAALVVVVVVIVAVLTFPWLLVLFLDFAVLLLFPILALVIIGWRVARRRPFTITAQREQQRMAEWRVVGPRDARRVERAIAEAIVAGGDPAELFPEYAQPVRPT